MNAYCKVTVLMEHRRLDMALPRGVPAAELLTQLLNLARPPQNRSQPHQWQLTKIDGHQISAEQSLSDAQVLDGDFLRLDSVGYPTETAVVEDVRDSVEDLIDSERQLWNPKHTLDFACLPTAAAALGLLLLTIATRLGQQHTGAAALGCATALAAASWLAQRKSRQLPASLLLIAGYGWAGLAGWSVASHFAAPGPARPVAALATALVLAAVARTVIPAAAVHLTALTILTAASGIQAALQVEGHGYLPAARAAALLGVLAVGALPRASIALGGLAAADYRVRNFGQLDTQQLRAKLQRGDRMLLGALVGMSLLVTSAAVVLATVSRTSAAARWDLPLAAAVGVLSILRSRAYSQVAQVTPLRLAGITVLGCCAYQLVSTTPVLAAWLAPIGVGVAVLLTLASAITLSDIGQARVKQALNRVEFLAVTATVVLASASAGFFDLAAKLSK